MGFESRKRKSWSDSSGVSEVVGNILILMITVVLFTSIIGFVNQIPVPEQEVKADFQANVAFSNGGANANLTITHVGGLPVLVEHTLIMVSIDQVNTPYYLTDDPSFTGDEWVPGASWTVELSGTSYTSDISVLIYDLDKDTGIWSSQVSGGSGENSPSILQRYVDSNPTTPTADPVKQGDNFTLFVKIIDADNDLDASTSSIYIDSSQFEGSGSAARGYDAVSDDGWYQWNFYVWSGSVIIYNATDLDGAVITIYASDLASHTSKSTYFLSVTILPVQPVGVPEPYVPPDVEGGLPAWLTWLSGRQGFGVYGELNESGTADTSDPRTTFEKDEMIFVRVASLDMSNILAENKISFIDTRTGLTCYPTFVSLSSLAVPFYPYASTGVFIYECKLNTTGLAPGSYAMVISLKNLPAGLEPEYRFSTRQIVTITQQGSSITFTPAVWMFKDSHGGTNNWGYSKTKPFEVAGSSYRVYVGVHVLDVQGSPSPLVEEVRIVDMQGGSQLYGVPPAGTMITTMRPFNTTSYNFTIDLRFNNADQWLGGTNAYTLYISRFSDLNEGVYSLSTQIYIKANLTRSDFLAGGTGIFSSQGGSQNFVSPEYLYYVENNNFFTTRTLFSYANAPSTTPDYMISAMAAGDMDGDGDKDLLVAETEGDYRGRGVLHYFENTLNTYGVWQGAASITRPTNDTTVGGYPSVVEWIAFGDINGDGDMDFVYASQAFDSGKNPTTARVVIYNNTYGMTPVVYRSWTGDIRKVDLKDMNGDGKADLIVLVGGKIYVYDLSQWKLSSSLLARLPNTDSGFTGGNGIRDFDIEDMNQDGKLDIVTVGDIGTNPSTTNTQGVWVNNYSMNLNPVVRLLDATFSDIGPGRAESGGVAQTQSDDGAYLVLRENSTAEDSPVGSLDAVFKTTRLTTSAEQILCVRAFRSSGSSEVFYAWYSVDGIQFIPMFTIADTTETNYTFRLPSYTADKNIYIKFTDSLSTTGSATLVERLYVDYVSVLSSTYGGYATSRYQVVSHTAGFICVRGANINGIEGTNPHLEVVAAKNTEWRVYEFKTELTAWTQTGKADFKVEVSAMDDCAVFSSIAPTLFDVVDVNGDSYSDFLVSNYTTVPSAGDFVNRFGVFINLNPQKWYLSVKDFFAGIVDPRGSLTVVISAALKVST